MVISPVELVCGPATACSRCGHRNVKPDGILGETCDPITHAAGGRRPCVGARPERVEQLVLGDELARTLGQVAQQGEALGPEWNGLAVTPELLVGRVHLERREGDQAAHRSRDISDRLRRKVMHAASPRCHPSTPSSSSWRPTPRRAGGQDAWSTW
jgi:hypothetical protein